MDKQIVPIHTDFDQWKKFCLYPSDLVKSSKLQLEKMLRESNRQYLENKQTVLSSPDSACQTV